MIYNFQVLILEIAVRMEEKLLFFKFSFSKIKTFLHLTDSRTPRNYCLYVLWYEMSLNVLFCSEVAVNLVENGT